MRKKRGWYDDVKRNMATQTAHKGNNIFGDRQGRPVTYNHAVVNVTALNVMHQRPDAPPLRAWWAELHAQQVMVAVIVSDHGLPRGRLVATEIQADELWIRKECGMKATWAHTAARRIELDKGAVQHHGGGVGGSASDLVQVRSTQRGDTRQKKLGEVLRSKARGERWTNEARATRAGAICI
jgi:hypothetical protein